MYDAFVPFRPVNNILGPARVPLIHVVAFKEPKLHLGDEARRSGGGLRSIFDRLAIFDKHRNLNTRVLSLFASIHCTTA